MKRKLQCFCKYQDNYIRFHVFVYLQAESMSSFAFEDKSGPTIECLKYKQRILSINMGSHMEIWWACFLYSHTNYENNLVLNCWFLNKHNLMCWIDKCFRHNLIKKLICMGTKFHGFPSFWDLLQNEKILPNAKHNSCEL